MQGEDFRDVAPWDAVDRGAEDEHILASDISFVLSICDLNVQETYGEEKRNAGGRRRPLNRCPLEAQQDGDHHHGEPKAEASPHHRLPATNAVNQERWDEGTEKEHDLDAMLWISFALTILGMRHHVHSTEEQGQIPIQADIDLEDGRDEVPR